MITDSLQKIDLMAYCIRRKLKWIMVTQFSATELFSRTNHVEVSLQLNNLASIQESYKKSKHCLITHTHTL